MSKNITVLVIGEIVGKLGRRVVTKILPAWRAKYRPDLITANVENLAHGKGVTQKTMTEMKMAGIDIFTSGDHIWDKQNPSFDGFERDFPIAVPANDSRAPEKLRWQTFAFGKEEIFVLNLVGQVFMTGEFTGNPFHAFDSIYEEMGKPKLLLVDIHTEATSEKVAFGHFAAGRASVVYGSHTHIPTSDERILNKSTGYITDIGMVGSDDSVLGVDKEVIIDRFLENDKKTFIYPEAGSAWFNGLLCQLDVNSGKCIKIQRLSEKTNIN
jgi:2',3'-cyclic-nucleotide 2'-phosphodiesterase